MQPRDAAACHARTPPGPWGLLCLVPERTGANGHWRAGGLAWADAPVGFPRARVRACVRLHARVVRGALPVSLSPPLCLWTFSRRLPFCRAELRALQPAQSVPRRRRAATPFGWGERRLPTRHPRKPLTQGPKRARPIARRRLAHTLSRPFAHPDHSTPHAQTAPPLRWPQLAALTDKVPTAAGTCGVARRFEHCIALLPEAASIRQKSRLAERAVSTAAGFSDPTWPDRG